MRLEELDARTLKRAVALYCQCAYDPDDAETHAGKAVPKDDASFAEVLSWFLDESDFAESAAHRRYALRLGNTNYPCMKLVLEEILYAGEFFFYVDTHDEVDLDQDAPEYDAWQELRSFNRKLKEDIEATWWNAGLATIRELRDRVAQEADEADEVEPSAEEDAVEKVIMVVDANRQMADTTAFALENHGYRTVEIFEPDRVILEAERLAPDLILVDVAVAGRSGREICKTLKANALTHKIPVALVAPRLGFFRNVPEVDACIFKPFDAGVLYRIVDHLVNRDNGEAE